MALDIHLGPNEEQAARSARVIAIDAVAHRQLFDRRLFHEIDCPLWRRMQDFSADAVYLSDEVARLISEVEILSERASPATAGILRQVAEIGRRALRERWNVYAFSD